MKDSIALKYGSILPQNFLGSIHATHCSSTYFNRFFFTHRADMSLALRNRCCDPGSNILVWLLLLDTEFCCIRPCQVVAVF